MTLEAAVVTMERLPWPVEDAEADGVSFGLADDARAAVAERLAALEKAVSQFAWIETKGCAVTRVNWGADFETVWQRGRTGGHWPTVEAELARRARLLRAVTAALQFAVRISLAAAAPATFLGALAAARDLANALQAVLCSLEVELRP